MRFEHTGGEGAVWKIIGSTIVQPCGRDRSIPVAFVSARPSENEHDANARLMAAAPDMLRAIMVTLDEGVTAESLELMQQAFVKAMDGEA